MKTLTIKQAAKATAQATAQTLHVSNILAVWYSANAAQHQDGAAWYDTARTIAQTLATRYGLTVQHVAGVIAATSPMKLWNQNVTLAEKILAGYSIGITAMSTGGTFKALLSKCDSILALECGLELERGILEALNSQKISSFYNNIVHANTDDVTVDGHAYNIAINGIVRVSIEEAPKISPTTYTALQGAYRLAADQLGVLPSVVQAVTWVTYRDMPIK